eukprot:gene3973-5693_t
MRSSAAKSIRSDISPFSMTVSSWFCLPDQGMKDLEILSRSSACIIKAQTAIPAMHVVYDKRFEVKKEVTTNSHHIVTVSHSIAPWRWPKLYPIDWLQLVNEKHTFYTVEMRNEDGTFLSQTILQPRVFHHPTRDLCALHLEEEDQIKLFKRLRVNFPDLLPNIYHPLQPNEPVEFYGHEVVGKLSESESLEDVVDNRRAIPRHVKGSIYARTNDQIFASTSPVLTDGMCGGPVLVKKVNPDKKSYIKTKTFCAGIIEGIVPMEHPDNNLAGTAAFVEAKVIAEFLSDLESGHIKPVVGGEIIDTVGADQDEDKMNWNKIINGE